MPTFAPLATSVLAFVTTIHVAMIVLRLHRSPTTGIFRFVAPVSIALAATPWLMPSAPGVALGLLAHLAWFVACERLLPVAKPRTAPSSAIVSAPAARSVLARRETAKPREFVRVPVIATLAETPDIRTFRLARPDTFEFTAGQFLTLRVRVDGRDLVRCYSISSSPACRGYLEISVKRIGLVSSTLHATVRPGTLLDVRAPAGAFTYPAGDDRPVVLLAGGVGITPLISMIRHGVASDPTRPLTLFYSVRTESDIAFLDEIRVLQKRHAQFRAFVAVTGGDVSAEYFPGRISDQLILRTVPEIAHAVCLICGPHSMIDAVAGTLASLGVPAPQIRSEVFNPAVAASAGTIRPARAADPNTGGSFEIEFSRSGRRVTVSGEQTILEAAESCDADIPSLCRAGVCGTCRTRVVSGESDCQSSTLDDQDRENGYVLPCVTRVISNCTVDA